MLEPKNRQLECGRCPNVMAHISSCFKIVFSVFASGVWATVCKTVRRILSDRCLSVLSSCLSVTLMHCGQTVGWINMKLGMELGLGLGHIVSDGDPAPLSQEGHRPQFSVHVCCGQTAGWIKMPLCREV